MLFNELKLKPFILKTLSDLKFKELTKIQEETIPTILHHKSLIITSQTGSGKTLCYLIPTLNDIEPSLRKTQTIILLPTKELARQVYSKYLEFINNEPSIRITLLIGNNDIEKQKVSIQHKAPHIIIGTTIRILELLEQKIINRDIKTIIIDEADMLTDSGFIPHINKIFGLINSESLQKIACSATTHESFANQLSKYLQNTRVVSTSKSIWANQNVSNNIVYTSENTDSMKTLNLLVKQINPYFCIVFCNTKKETIEIFQHLTSLFPEKKIGILHKDLSTRQRKKVFNEINTNQYQYLVSTDLGSRGIDIVGADVVISYGLPEDDKWFMHRIGRVGRYKDSGSSFVIYRKGIDNVIIRLTKKNIDFHYYLLKGDSMIEKPLELRMKKKLMFDQKTNNAIKTIINKNKRVKPGYKKKIKNEIFKIKQKIKHKFIEQKIKKNLIFNNIKNKKK